MVKSTCGFDGTKEMVRYFITQNQIFVGKVQSKFAPQMKHWLPYCSWKADN